MFDIKLEGFDQLQENLDNLKRKAEQLDGTNSVPLNELFSDTFVVSRSKYSSLQEMLDDAPLEINSNKDLETKEWSEFVEENTKFSSWEDMLSTAAASWLGQKIF